MKSEDNKTCLVVKVIFSILPFTKKKLYLIFKNMIKKQTIQTQILFSTFNAKIISRLVLYHCPLFHQA